MINGEINFQQSLHLLFTCFPVLVLRSFENLQERARLFRAIQSSDRRGDDNTKFHLFALISRETFSSFTGAINVAGGGDGGCFERRKRTLDCR